jgi:type I restriction enzyme S subunit
MLEHYDRVADTGDAMPRLRHFILDLAVSGKLVPQDPRDEPASELLNRIVAEKAWLLGRGKISRRQVEAVSGDDAPFKLPAKWCWTRIGDICSKTGSGSTPRGGKSVYRAGGVPFLRSQNIYNDGLHLDDVAYIDQETHRKMDGTVVRSGDLLLNITGGSIGRCCLIPESFSEANVSQHVAIIRIAVNGIEHFLHRLVLSPYFQAFVFDEQTGAGRGGLPKNKMDQIPVALPPLAEQHRIVAKVDELMSLCDRLETSRAEREATRDRLAAASFARLSAPDPESFQDDAGFVLNALPTLTTRADQIKQLRETILNLAVCGKLVPQDPSDKPASELLERIAAEKDRLVAAREIRKQQPLPRLQSVEAPFELPECWLWVRLGEIGFTQTGTTPSSNNPEYFGNYIPFVKPANLTGNDVDYSGGGISKLGIAHSRVIKKSSVLMVCIGSSIGKVNVADRDICCNQQINAITPHLVDNTRFTSIALKAHFFQKLVRANAGMGTLPIINKGKWEILPIPLPPRAEQGRIVAKVDELMGLCNQLEAALSETDATRRRLLSALLAEALIPT